VIVLSNDSTSSRFTFAYKLRTYPTIRSYPFHIHLIGCFNQGLSALWIF